MIGKDLEEKKVAYSIRLSMLDVSFVEQYLFIKRDVNYQL